MRHVLLFFLPFATPAFASGFLTAGIDDASARSRLDKSWNEVCEFPDGITGFHFQASVTSGGYLIRPTVRMIPEGAKSLPLQFCIDKEIDTSKPLRASGESGELHYTFQMPAEEKEQESVQASGPMATTITITPDGEITIVQSNTNEGDESPP